MLPSKKRTKAASASGGGGQVQKRQKVSAVSWGEVGPLLRALPQAKLLNVTAPPPLLAISDPGQQARKSCSFSRYIDTGLC
jgi:hypothetical protein